MTTRIGSRSFSLPFALRLDKKDLQALVVLTVILIIAALPYVGGLGFYGDDWHFLSHFVAPGQSFSSGLAQSPSEGLNLRPFQAWLFAQLYTWFGLTPLGHHLVNHGLLILALWLLFITGRALGLTRSQALTVTLIYGLMPHYSTTRFWFSTVQAQAALVCLFLSFYLTIWSFHVTGFWRWSLAGLAVAGTFLSGVGYEIFLPLFPLGPGLAYLAYRRTQAGLTSRPPLLYACGLIAAHGLIIAALFAWKAVYSTRLEPLPLSEAIVQATNIMTEVVVMNITGDYGLRLPLVLSRVVLNYFNLVNLLAAAMVTAFVYVVLRRLARSEPDAQQTLIGPGWLSLIGVSLFVLGYAVFWPRGGAAAETTGINNRTIMAAALGLALIQLAGLQILSRFVQHRWPRLQVFPVTVAGLCGAYTLILTTLGMFWAVAAQQQQVLIEAFRRDSASLPSHSRLLLDGFCPYVGPALVVEAFWDATGLIRLATNNDTLEADVVTERLSLTEEAVQVKLYGSTLVYPYADLYIYQPLTGRLTPLHSAAEARQYFAQRVGLSENQCQSKSQPGRGAFPWIRTPVSLEILR